MANPPSIVKITRDGVQFEDRSKLAGWTMEQLQRRALMDIGRYITYEVRKALRSRSKFLRKSRYAAYRFQYWVRRKENDLQIGMENISKGARTAWWADQSELGTDHQPLRPQLQTCVQQNIRTIREIEEKYLGMMDNETAAIAAASAVPDGDVVE